MDILDQVTDTLRHRLSQARRAKRLLADMCRNLWLGFACLVFVALASDVVAAASAPPAPDDTALCRQITLASSPGGRQAAAIAALARQPAATLEAFKRHFATTEHNARFQFQTEVLPKLPPDEVKRFLLAEFREGLPVHYKMTDLVQSAYLQAEARIKKEGLPSWELDQQIKREAETRELLVAVAPLEEADRWFEWVARPAAKIIDSYDEARDLLLREATFDHGAGTWAEAMARLDRPRAVAEFSRLLESAAADDRGRGVEGFRAIRQAPDPEAWRYVFAHTDGMRLIYVCQLVYQTDRSQLDLILPLLEHPEREVRGAAEYRLESLGCFSQKQIAELTQSPRTPAERLAWWTDWWKDRRGLSAEAFAAERVKAFLSPPGRPDDEEVLRISGRFPDRLEVVPYLVAMLDSPQDVTRSNAASTLAGMTGPARGPAIEALLAFCRTQPPAKAALLCDALARTKDPRAVEIVLKLVETEPSAARLWSQPWPFSLGPEADRRAAEILATNWVIAKGDSWAASGLAQIEGARVVLPRLLEALVKEPDQNKRSSIRTAIENVADDRVATELTRLLPQAKGGAGRTEGPRSDVLQLMAIFPDPAARPALLELLKSDDPWTRIHATAALGPLGDTAGVAVLIRDAISAKEFFQGSYSYGVSGAIKAAATPETRRQLIDACREATGETRRRLLILIVQQRDAAYLDLLDPLLGDADRTTVRQAAAAIMASMAGTMKPPASGIAAYGVTMPANLLPPIRLLLAYVFLGEKVRPDDEPFPNGGGLKDCQGGVIGLPTLQCLQYKKEDRSLTVVNLGPHDQPKAPDGSAPRRGGAYVSGRLEWGVSDRYLVLTLDLGSGGTQYLFRRDGGDWKPVCSTVAWMH
jgi:HEAT repeat protein